MVCRDRWPRPKRLYVRNKYEPELIEDAMEDRYYERRGELPPYEMARRGMSWRG
jgi:hypothetical protein